MGLARYVEPELAAQGVAVLTLVLGVAIFAYVVRSRTAFLLGCVGSLLGLVIPQPRVYAHYASVEGAAIGNLEDLRNHVLFWGVIGAAAACAAAAYLFPSRARRPPLSRFSVRGLLIAVAVIAILTAAIRALSF
jgi:hypothetical protein